MTATPTTTAMSAAGLSITGLRELIKRDLAVSNELRERLDQMRKDISEGKDIPAEDRNLMDQSNKAMAHDLIQRIEQIEKQPNHTATDREMLQVLNARLAVCDLQATRMAELGDLTGRKQDGFLEPAEHYRQVRRKKARSELTQPLMESTLPPSSITTAESQPIDPRDVGRGAFATPLHERLSESSTAREMDAEDDADADAEYEYVYVDEEGNEVPVHESDHEPSDPEEDKSLWPLLWRILDVPPCTPAPRLPAELEKAKAKLALKHDPKNFPNDADAPRRWAAVTKASDVLSDAERREYYLFHDKVPDELLDFDLGGLRIGEGRKGA